MAFGSGLLLSESVALIRTPCSLLDGLTQRESDQVLRRGTRRFLKKGAALFRQGGRSEGIYLIESGCLRVFYTAPSGKQLTLAYWLPGNFVGDPDILGGDKHSWSAVATRDSIVTNLASHAVRQLILDNPAMALAVINGLVFKAKCYSAVAQMLATRSIMERLSYVLLQLADLYGTKEGGGVFIRESFTHSELAQLVGSTRQWVTIALKRMQDDGVLTHQQGQIRILNTKSLLALHRQTRQRRT